MSGHPTTSPRVTRYEPESITQGAINGVYLWRVAGRGVVTISGNKRRAIARWRRMVKWIEKPRKDQP